MIWPRTVLALVSGLIFGLGLTLSGMINPHKVLAFLDITGDWDPSLALVLVSALAVSGVGYRLVLARSRPLFDREFHLPAAGRVDLKLLAGSGLFGIGWGLAGFCPGPALSAITLAFPQVLIFLGAMLAGMLAQNEFNHGLRARTASADGD